MNSAPIAPPRATHPETQATREELLQASLLGYASGNQLAFSKLYDELARMLYVVIFQIVRDHREAEDILQESFVHIWKKAATFDPLRGKAFSWAAIIARNKAIDHVRARQRRHDREAALTEYQETFFPTHFSDMPAGQRAEENHLRTVLRYLPAVTVPSCAAQSTENTTRATSRRNAMPTHEIIPPQGANRTGLDQAPEGENSNGAGKSASTIRQVRAHIPVSYSAAPP